MKLTFALATCASAQFADTPWKVDNFNNLNDWNINVVPNSHNNEYQYYTNRYENVHVENGVLKIIPKREKGGESKLFFVNLFSIYISDF